MNFWMMSQLPCGYRRQTVDFCVKQPRSYRRQTVDFYGLATVAT